MVKYLLFKKNLDNSLHTKLMIITTPRAAVLKGWFEESLGPSGPFGGPRSQIFFMIILRSI